MADIERNEELQAALEEAARLSELGDDAEALDLLLQLESEYSSDATLLCMIGALAEQVGAEGMAVDFFQRCLALGPADVEVLITAGAGLAAMGDPEAEPALRLAALTAPQNPAARMHYGALLVRNGLIAQGIEELVTAKGIDPEDGEIRRELGIAFLLDNRLEEGTDELEAAVAADPEESRSRLLWGLALLQNEEVSRAAEELHPLGSALEQDGEVQLLLALVYALAGWEEESWIALSRAESAEPPVDGATFREVEEALEWGSDAVHDLLVGELAPMTLRERILAR